MIAALVHMGDLTTLVSAGGQLSRVQPTQDVPEALVATSWHV